MKGPILSNHADSRNPAPVERRVWVRHRGNGEAKVNPLSAATGVFWTGKIQNISTHGIALLLDRRFDQGTLLTVALPGKSKQDLKTFPVRVVQDRFVPGSSGLRWVVGCVFLQPLSEEELQGLLQAEPGQGQAT